MNNINVSFDKFKENFQNLLTIKSKKRLYIWLSVLTAVITFVSIYFFLMPINIASSGFRAYLVIMALLWASPMLFKVKQGDAPKKGFKSVSGVFMIITLALIGIIIVLSFSVSPLFMSKQYRDLMTITESNNFATEVELSDTMLIPTVDEALAVKLGEKKLGDKNLGSQFKIGDYNMIEQGGKLYWIAPIEYRGLFQWMNKPTTPGYALVNACDQSDVKIVEEKLPYVSSAYLWDNIDRKIYFQNMFRLRENRPHLELDDEGNPVYVESVLEKRFAYSSGLDNKGVIVTDARTGKCSYYERDNAPSWIDQVMPADLIDDQLNYYGSYIHGFWNSVFAKKGVLKVSSGVNYIYSNDDVYLYTGLTSIGADDSIVGMSLTNMRTKQSTLYKVSGATESAAARSALGKVQEKRYSASDPVLINYKGEPTYFMLLKDDEGLVKQYAYVNVADYTIVSVNENQTQALIDYAAMIRPQDDKQETLTIKSIKDVVIDGNTVYLIRFNNPKTPEDEGYVEDFESKTFKANIQLNPDLAFMQAGTSVQVRYILADNENIIKYIKAA